MKYFKGQIHSKRQFYVQMALEFLRLPQKDYRTLNGRLRHLKDNEIHKIEDWIREAKRESDNPQRLFNWFIKESRK